MESFLPIHLIRRLARLLLLLILAAAARGHAQSPPEAFPDPSAPFVDSVFVVLTVPGGGGNTDIYYDVHPTPPTTLFTTATATRYDDDKPILLTEGAVIRAQAVYRPLSSSRVVTFTYTKNRPPSVSITSPASGATLRRAAPYSLTAAASDPDGHSVQVAYQIAAESSEDWASLGLSNAAPAYSAEFPWDGKANGRYRLRAVASDVLGESTVSGEVTITLAANNGPLVTWKSPAGGAVLPAGQAVTLVAEAYDQDTDGALTRVEFFRGTTSVGVASPVQGQANHWSVTWADPVAGLHELQAKAWDNHSPPQQGVSTSVTVTVRAPNQRPTVSLAGSTPQNPPRAPATVNLMASASDSDGAVSSVAFYQGPTLLLSDTEAPYGISVPGLAAGTHTFTARAFDNASPRDSAVSIPFTVTVAGNGPPVTDAGRDTAVTLPGTLALAGSASDPDGDSLSYRWIIPPGVSLGSTSSRTPTATFSTHGVFTILLEATESGGGLKDTDEVKVTVYRTPAITSRLTDTVVVGAPFNITVTASGYLPPALSAGSRPAWLAFTPSTSGDGTGRFSGTPPSGTSQPVAVSLTAANNVGSDTRTWTLHLRDPARITADHPETLAVVQEGARYAMSVGAVGTPPPTYQWQLLTSTGAANVGTNSPTFALDPASPSHSGTYRVIVRNGVGAPDTGRSIQVDVKAAIRIGGFGPFPGQTVVVGRRAAVWVKATGAGPLQYQWFRGSAALGPAASRDTLYIDAVRFADAGLYRARVTNPWSDTLRAGTFAWSDTSRLTVEQPRVDRPKADPVAPHDYRDDTLTVKLRTDTPGTQIRFTLDGTLPTASGGIAYDPATGVRLLKSSATLRARAYKDGYLESDLFVGTYTYVPKSDVAPPTARPAAELFRTSVLCTLLSSTPGARFRYTLDGSNPKTSPTAQDYEGPIRLSATTTVTAFAHAANMNPSANTTKTYTLEKPLTPAQAPEALPGGGPFSTQVQVTLSSRTAGAAIHFTVDGSSPETSPTRVAYVPGAVLTFNRTTVLKAQATRSEFLPSPVATFTYTLIPGPVESDQPGGIAFKDTLRVRLSATTAGSAIWYTLTDALPLDSAGAPHPDALPYDAAQGILLAQSATITAMALKDKVPGKASRFTYNRKGGPLATPLALTEGNAFTFTRTLRVMLYSTPGSTIHYTTDGRVPTTASPAYGGEIWLDTTTTLQAVAVQRDFQASKILVANFTLVADTPRADPPGGSFPTSVPVVLTAASPKTTIRYTEDGSVPGPDNGKVYDNSPIWIHQRTVLKAVAFSGGVPGPVLTETYDIFVARDTVLHPSETYFMPGGYSLAIPGDQTGPARVKLDSSQGLSLRGFRDVQYTFTLSPAEGAGQALPGLVLSRPPAEHRALYKVEPGGLVYFISAAARVDLSEPGTYFLGTDATPPIITPLPQSAGKDDSTVARFRFEDNVHNLYFDLKRSDNPSLNLGREPVFSGSERTFRLRNEVGAVKALALQLSASDWRSYSHYPPDGQSHLQLSQVLKTLEGPAVWRVGVDPAAPHDLVGVPFALDPPLTLGDLADSRSGPVEAFVYRPQDGRYRRVARTEALVPGQAYWLASGAALTGLKRKSARIAGHGPGKFTVRLQPGWNQVSNPHLDTLYWPHARHLGATYLESPVKGLWSYAPETPRKYLERDALEPWKGYYVYSYLASETTVELLSRPPVAPALKKEASSRLARLSLAYGESPALLLGAAGSSSDGLGFEDEALIPALSARHRLAALRQGRALSCDWVRLGDGVLQWRVLAAPVDGAAEAPPLRVLGRDLPEGYEAWALSRARGMRVRLDAGASLPASGLSGDTLRVVAGPPDKLAALDIFRNLSDAAPSLDARVRSAAGGPEIEIDLPDRARVTATLWTLDGRRLGELRRSLPAGRYRFRYAEDFRSATTAPAPGVHVLRFEARGPGLAKVLTRKVVFRD